MESGSEGADLKSLEATKKGLCLSFLHRAVDDLFKLFNAAGPWKFFARDSG